MASDRRRLAEQCKLATRAAVESLGGRATRAAIRDRALRDGGFTALQLALPAPPSKPSCTGLVDYYLSWSLSWLKKEGVLANEARGIWSLEPLAAQVPIVIDVAARHEELTRRGRRRWPWARR